MAALGEWLTVTEAKELTGYDAQHIRRIARAGRVECQKWGTTWMINRSSLLAYVEEKGHGPQRKRKKLDKM